MNCGDVFGLIKQQLCLCFQLPFAGKHSNADSVISASHDSLLPNCGVKFSHCTSRQRHKDSLFFSRPVHKTVSCHTWPSASRWLFSRPLASVWAIKSRVLRCCSDWSCTSHQWSGRVEAKSILFWSVGWILPLPVLDWCLRDIKVQEQVVSFSLQMCPTCETWKNCKIIEWRNKSEIRGTVLGVLHMYSSPYRERYGFPISTAVGAERHW